MNATDELCALLDARGAEWSRSLGSIVEWVGANERLCRAYARPEPLTVDVAMLSVPPAQAVEATLGRETCQIEERHGEWRCTGCGEIVGDSDPWSELYINGNAIKLWNYCPNCGREVVE